MTGEEDLHNLLSSLSPVVMEGEFVFCTFAGSGYGDNSGLEPIASYMEREGLTLIVPRHKADEHAIAYESVFRCITLTVHSSLEAVGLTAAVAETLAERGISANVVAAYYHDHIFVPSRQVERARQALDRLAHP